MGGLNKLDKALFNKESILGGSCNLNSIRQGIYSYYIENGIPQNAPSDLQRGVIIMYEGQSANAQVIMDWERKKSYHRVNNNVSGSEWCEWF